VVSPSSSLFPVPQLRRPRLTLTGVRESGNQTTLACQCPQRPKNATRNIPLIFTLNSSEAILTLAALGFLGFGI
jgi:hypothetical protein